MMKHIGIIVLMTATSAMVGCNSDVEDEPTESVAARVEQAKVSTQGFILCESICSIDGENYTAKTASAARSACLAHCPGGTCSSAQCQFYP